jgi:hypothetical protein
MRCWVNVDTFVLVTVEVSALDTGIAAGVGSAENTRR